MPAVLYSKGYFSLEMPALKYRLVCICPVQICMHNNNNKVDSHCIALLLPTHTYWCVCVCVLAFASFAYSLRFCATGQACWTLILRNFHYLKAFLPYFLFISPFFLFRVCLSSFHKCQLARSGCLHFNSFVIIYSLSAFVATLFVLTVSNDRTTLLDIMT